MRRGKTSLGSLLTGLLLALFSASCAEKSERVAKGSGMPHLPVVYLSGAKDDLAALHRDRGALVVFWATWCAPCRAEVPDINQLAERYAARDFVVLGVAMGEPLNVVKAGATQLGINYPVVVAPDITYLSTIGIEKVPTFVLLDDKGRVLMVENGLTEGLRSGIEQLRSRRSAEN